MKFKIYGKQYDVDSKLAGSAKALIQQILEKVKDDADVRHIPNYYTAFVVMMYVVSSSILKEINVDKIVQLLKKEEEDNADNGKSENSKTDA